MILIAFAVAIATPWLIVTTDINTRPYSLPGGRDWVVFHSKIVVHSPDRAQPMVISLKDVFVVIAIGVLVALIFSASVRERRNQAPGFAVQDKNSIAGPDSASSNDSSSVA